MTDRGVLFHAKHAFMPNNLGYCGPDDNEMMLEGLEAGKPGEGLVSSLQRFEAAYPFLKLIARSTGRQVFDYSVPEAYWIGNSLLEKVEVPEFYEFSHREVRGRDPKEVRRIFKTADGMARPHHTFYVMSTFASGIVPGGPNMANEAAKKVSQQIDNCRVSWGVVRSVGRRDLEMEYTPVTIEGGRLCFASPVVKKAQYNPEVSPFASVKAGDCVSLHWNYACEVLTPRQLKNLEKYTRLDMALANKLFEKGWR